MKTSFFILDYYDDACVPIIWDFLSVCVCVCGDALIVETSKHGQPFI